MDMNQCYMIGSTPQEREDKGFQSWCADMWGVLHTLWALGRKTEIIPEMRFLHATTVVEDMKDSVILHNAGITDSGKIKARVGKDRIEVECPAFYKGDYIAKEGNPSSPFKTMDKIKQVAENEESKKYCTSLYAAAIIKIYNKYKLEY